jgi:hypothetical protein
MKNGRIGTEQRGSIWVNWVEVEGPLAGATRRYPATALAATGQGRNLPDGSRVLDKNGDLSVKIHVPAEGIYYLRAKVAADQAGEDYPKMEWRVNGKTVETVNVDAPDKLVPIEGQRVFSTELLNAMPYVYETHQKLPAGDVTISAAFTNEFADPTNPNPNLRKRDLHIYYLETSAPGEVQPLPPIPAPLEMCFAAAAKAGNDKVAGARDVLAEFTRRAWRRPVTAAELDGLVSLFKMADARGDAFPAAMKLPMKAVLVSPNFLFRGETQPDPDNPKSVHPIDEYALASRLSYFLWSSMPDDELLDLAGRGELRKNLDAQVKRMLASPKSEALVDNFAGQWLQIRNLQFVAPDKDQFPDFDEELRDAMMKETQLFFSSIMRQDSSVMDFITADYTFVNERLAKHYGIPNITGSDFQKVSLANTPRRGLLAQASILTITSNPTRTSPVKRGKWVLDNLLGQPPPPPPPDVPALKDDGKPVTGTLRQQMEAHRVNPTCMSCHSQMDPLGFGLENFDAIGKIRTKDGEFPIDVSGQLVTGETFNGTAELTKILSTTKRDDFIRCLSDKMLTYALGRGTEFYDRPAIDKITEGLDSDGDKFSRLITEVVNSLPFQDRRGDGSLAAK